MRKRLRPRPRRSRSRRHVLLLWILVICMAMSLLFVVIDMRLRPIVRQYATARVNYLATTLINDAITEEMSLAGGMYDNLVGFEKNNAGEIMALKTDIIKINQLKAAIVTAISRKIAAIDSTDISVPLGNVISGTLFSGRGPLIPIKLVPLGSANANFISVFTNAGINQTRHQILIEATVSLSIILPGESASCEVTSQVSIAETLLVGNVPESYTYIEDARQDILEKFNDYGTHP